MSENGAGGAVDGVPRARQEAVARVARELERHVASAGWDGPVRLFALVNTASAIAAEPSLADRLPPDAVAMSSREPEHLTAVEQEGLPEAESLEELLAGIAWPGSVDGAAVVVERSVLPPAAEAELPEDEQEALAWAREHPDREDVRLAVAVLRGGAHACALRTRTHDEDHQVAVQPDLAPGLVAAVAATLEG